MIEHNEYDHNHLSVERLRDQLDFIERVGKYALNGDIQYLERGITFNSTALLNIIEKAEGSITFTNEKNMDIADVEDMLSTEDGILTIQDPDTPHSPHAASWLLYRTRLHITFENPAQPTKEIHWSYGHRRFEEESPNLTLTQ